jgi:molecular chaperone HtpG
MLAKKTLELNPHHSAMKEMLAKVKESADGQLDKASEDLAHLMFNMAMLNSGFNIDDPIQFTAPLMKLINVGFGLDRDEPVEEIEIEIDEDEPEPTKSEGAGDADEEEIVIDGDSMTHTSSKAGSGNEAMKNDGGEEESHDDL